MRIDQLLNSHINPALTGKLCFVYEHWVLLCVFRWVVLQMK